MMNESVFAIIFPPTGYTDPNPSMARAIILMVGLIVICVLIYSSLKKK
jgi:hypothetical protein